MTTHILMVDDEPDAQDLFRQNFRREIRKGVYSFEFAQSGREALEVIKTKSPVLVLSDINMPGMSGIELLSELHSLWPELPVLMISAYGDAGTEARVRALGAERLVAKPVDFAGLKDVLEKIAGDAP
ncbi:response regulator [Ruegeria marina]|uniref:Response regulator receiver domain-containing protein n=1 Tax=Ruegeria marina TaxID=639004 RepID=A0A1G6VUB8_9RHOB|nr:response regulator [Ruegeria marina]SDD56436.1 Response regulator receiver domain-containing protein [Ruegeria marina]